MIAVEAVCPRPQFDTSDIFRKDPAARRGPPDQPVRVKSGQ